MERKTIRSKVQVTIRITNAAHMNNTQKKGMAAWLRREAGKLYANSLKYDPDYRARYGFDGREEYASG